jgi:hypothetical protein
MLQAGMSRVRIPIRLLDFFFNLLNHSSCIMVLSFTQPLTEMSTRNLPGDKGRPAQEADSLNPICELILKKNVSSLSQNPIGIQDR